MVYSKIKVFGCDVCVIPTARDNVKSELLIRERESNLPIGDSELPQMYILPSLSADAETVAASRSEWGHTLSPTVQTAAAAVFMRCTRGLPIDEIEIKSEDEILTAFIDAKNRIISLKMPKCTLKHSNICQNYANCEISSRVYSTKIGNVIVVKCENSSFFSRDAHLSFLYSAAREYVASVSYSIEDNGIHLSAVGIENLRMCYPELCAAVVKDSSAYSSRRGECKIYIDECSFSVVHQDGSLLICDTILDFPFIRAI